MLKMDISAQKLLPQRFTTPDDNLHTCKLTRKEIRPHCYAFKYQSEGKKSVYWVKNGENVKDNL